MDSPDNTFYGIVGIVKSWIPWRSEPANVSRAFWMPDQSCRVCYECDSQFTIINRRHHCRLCGRVFCARCTSNSIPTSSGDLRTVQEDSEKIRVCNYCYRQWEQGMTALENGMQVAIQDPCTSPSSASAGSNSIGTSSCVTLGSMAYSTGTCQPVQLSPRQSSAMEMITDGQGALPAGMSDDLLSDVRDPSHEKFTVSMNRSDDEDDDYGVYELDTEARRSTQANGYYGPIEFDEMGRSDGRHKVHPEEQTINGKSFCGSPVENSFQSQRLQELQQYDRKDENYTGDEAPSSIYVAKGANSEPVDFDSSAALWLPPEPEDEDDEREALLSDDEEEGGATGEWGYLRASSSFGSGEFRTKDRSSEEHKRAMKNVVYGHFRALVAQLLQVDNLSVGEENDRESWLEIVTSLSWEAASLLKPDMSTGGGMDPGGYVKVKCVASGRRTDSLVVKGVVCKKNVAHRRMTSKIEKPRILILGGALEYQRVSTHLSSFDTLLQQEMDHLKMAVAKIDVHQPDVLLVENSVSRFAQEYLLAKDISLVLNIKRPLLERISRCTGAQIIPSVDHLSSPRLGYCEKFHVERFVEELGPAGQGGKKLVKTLMYFEGCPKPLGCTVLLRGANADELKKVKHVVKYGVFAAYHLALETSFLADEGASLPELPLNSPITVALPDKSSRIESSISTVPGFGMPPTNKSHVELPSDELERSNGLRTSDLASPICTNLHRLIHGPSSQDSLPASLFARSASIFSSDSLSGIFASEPSRNEVPSSHIFLDGNGTGFMVDSSAENNLPGKGFGYFNLSGQHKFPDCSQNHQAAMVPNHHGISEVSSLGNSPNPLDEPGYSKEDPGPLKEEFPPSPSDHQSILVQLSSRCVWKGTVCERSHLFRIKYYGSFDKPLGRFLRDHLFDQNYRCRTCEMPSEAHVQCYTHRQGTLTISVKKLPEIVLPGEKEGKIWMWHRCLLCPRINGYPPATQRVVMSDAAWGLSFGKFLELSFSNHAAASRVASCGHSLHRDCLRFYGFGNMVACFRYATIDVLSVHLPPPKLDFCSEKQEWIQEEVDEVVGRAELLVSEILNALRQLSEKRRQIAELEGILQKEKAEFEESLQKILSREVKKGLPVIDILEINRLRRRLLFQAYMWDHRLIHVASLDNSCDQTSLSSSTLGFGEKPVGSCDKLSEIRATIKQQDGLGSCEPVLLGEKLDPGLEDSNGLDSGTNESNLGDKEACIVQGPDNGGEEKVDHSTSMDTSDQAEPPLEVTGNIGRVLSDGRFPPAQNFSETLEAAWTGEYRPLMNIARDNSGALFDSALDESTNSVAVEELESDDHNKDRNEGKIAASKSLDSMEDSVSRLGMPFLNFWSLNMSVLTSAQKLDIIRDYNPVYISSFRELEQRSGVRMLLPAGTNDIVVPVFDDEPTSIIAYALISAEYDAQLKNELERQKDIGDLMSSSSFSDTMTHNSDDDSTLSMSGSRSSLVLDPVSYTKAMHARVSFDGDSASGKKYSVTCYYAKRFEALRRISCPSEIDFIRSLSRCKKWGAQGGKSNVFFAKTLDDRFIIKQVTKTELESFIKFAPEYFKYLSESISSGSPTCLAKILGIYQVTKHLKGSKMDVLVMENLLFGRNIVRVYDLKGSARSRYNPDSKGANKVLLDQNLIEAMPTSPIFVGNKAKRLLERAVWNDTSFLASIDVMDYSLLVGVDEEKHVLVLGIIDFMRQYTWDKHLETWVKASGILGGPKNEAPTVISPKQYKKRFRKAMTTYFLMVPDQWSPPSIVPSKSQSDLGEETAQDGAACE